jgi:hypothetical protein
MNLLLQPAGMHFSEQAMLHCPSDAAWQQEPQPVVRDRLQEQYQLDLELVSDDECFFYAMGRVTRERLG